MKTLILFLLIASAQCLQAFDTVYKPNQHAAIVAIQCDDRVDSQYVNIALDHGISISFAPYNAGSSAIIDYDSTYAKGDYGDWLIGWAQQKGMELAVHSEAQAPLAWYSGGEDSLKAVWAQDAGYLATNTSTPPLAANDVGFVWVGHVNNPQCRALAKEYGFKYTRGLFGGSQDLYNSFLGWQSTTGASGYPPIPMIHEALIPSGYAFRLTSYASSDSLYQGSTTADTAHLWVGTLAYLDELASRNGFVVLNIHPAWGAPHAETQADSMVSEYLVIHDTYAEVADSIKFNTRRGVASTRNDVSAFQLDYILHAMQYWSDSTASVDGTTALCVPKIGDIVGNPLANLRDDNSSDPDVVSDWSDAAPADSTTNTYWESNDGLYSKDPALDRTKKIYVDGTGTVRAGNGTLTYPLPTTAWTELFNCEVVFTGHSVGDTLTVTAPVVLHAGNVTYDFAGLTLQPDANTESILTINPGNADHYLHDITIKNAKLDMETSTTDYAMNFGVTLAEDADSLTPTGTTLKGVTFINTKLCLTASNAIDFLADSCFFMPGSGTISNTAASVCFAIAGDSLTNPMFRNSVFDLEDTGAASHVVWYLNPPTDSLRMLNNVYLLGNSLDTDDAHYIITTNNDSTETAAKAVRFSGSYIAHSITTADSMDIWYSSQRTADFTFAELQTYISTGTHDGVNNFISPGWSFDYDYLADVSDTTKYGGYTGTGRVDTGTHASIGPVLYSNAVAADPIGTYPFTTPMRTLELLRVMKVTGAEYAVRVNDTASQYNMEIWLNAPHPADPTKSYAEEAVDTLKVTKAQP